MQYFPEVVTGQHIRRWEERKRGVWARVVAGEDRHFLRAHDNVVTPQALKQCLRRSVAWLPRGTTAADTTLVKALARAFRWRRMIETGRYGTIDELAAAEKINSSNVSRLLLLQLPLLHLLQVNPPQSLSLCGQGEKRRCHHHTCEQCHPDIPAMWFLGFHLKNPS